MKVLVTGAGGFLGRHVVERLLQGGHQVRAMIRPASPMPPWPQEVEVFPADLRGSKDLDAAFLGIGAVVHLAAGTSGSEDVQFVASVLGSERFLDAMAKSSVKRLLHVSSLVVYDWAKAKRTLDERTPLLAAPYDMGPYTIAKVWQERLVQRMATKHSWQLTILRPGFIWGTDHTEIAAIGRRFGKIHLMFGPLSRLPLTHVQNCADFIAVALNAPEAIGETFNVVDSDDIRVWRYFRYYAARTGQRALLVPLPYHFGLSIASIARWISQALFGSAGKLPSLLHPRRYEAQFKPVRFSNAKAREKLAWTPRLAFREALAVSYGTR